jgi:hypothetical protein
VVGTAASGAPEITAQKSQGLGDYLGKAANLVSAVSMEQAGLVMPLLPLACPIVLMGPRFRHLNSMILNRSRQAELGLKEAEANDKIKAIAGNVALVRRLYPNLSDSRNLGFCS